MSNPFLVQIPFALNGSKNPIQITRQPNQDDEDATYNSGFPPVTMVKEELGGKPPKGPDFNGIFYELSSPVVHYCKGGRIYFDQDYADAIGGYPKDHILAANDGLRDFISLVDANTANPNSGNITGLWRIYSGAGSVPLASSSTTGTVKIINTLNSTAVDAALTAAQGKVLQDGKLGRNENAVSATNCSRSIVAGNGLSGGGNLTADRTLTLGTPGTVTASTGNTVSASSHTHNLDVGSLPLLGVGQTWQNPSRVLGSTYTNNTGRPIQVSVCISHNEQVVSVMRVSNIIVSRFRQDVDSATGYQDSTHTAIVPNGATYSVTGGSLISWAELR